MNISNYIQFRNNISQIVATCYPEHGQAFDACLFDMEQDNPSQDPKQLRVMALHMIGWLDDGMRSGNWPQERKD